MTPEDATLDVLRLSDLVTPFVVRVAATLHVADHIAAGRNTARAIAVAEEAHELALRRLLQHLVTLGFLTGADDEYALTPRGDVLRADHAAGLRAVLDLDGALGRAEMAFVQLLHSVRTGAAGYPAQYGRDFWSDIGAQPELQANYDAAMATDVRAWAPPIIAAYDWGSLGHIVDVAGGDGTLLLELLRAFPTLRGTLFDQPTTATTARAAIAAADLQDRCDAVGGDFFASVPAGADAYLLTAIIHDWDDEHAVAILRRCADAAGSTGRVFIIEKIGLDGATPNTAMDLRLLVYMNGVERTPAELGALVQAAGMRVAATHPAGAITILQCEPVG